MPLFLSSVGSFESQTSFNGVNAAEANQIINSGVMRWILDVLLHRLHRLLHRYLVSYDNTAFSLHVLSPRYAVMTSRPSLGLQHPDGSGRGGDGVRRLGNKWTPGAFPHRADAPAGINSPQRLVWSCVMDTFISPPVAPPSANRSRNPKNNEGPLISCCSHRNSGDARRATGSISVVVYIFGTQDVLTLVYAVAWFSC